MLISVARYRAITSDTASATAVVTEAIEDAQSQLEEQLGRGLELDERTERVRVFPDGAIYPRCTPLVAVPDGSEIQGVAVIGGGPHSSALVDPDTHTTLTYTGGYNPDETDRSAVTFVPVELARAIAWAARAILTPGDGLEVPPGATSVSVGDVSISWGPAGSPTTGEVTFPRSLLRRYRYRPEMAA